MNDINDNNQSKEPEESEYLIIKKEIDPDCDPVNDLRLMTMAGQILFILLPALLFAKWIYSDVGKIIRIRRPDWKELSLFIIGIVILTPLLQSYLYIQNYFFY